MSREVLFEEHINDGIVSKYWIRQFSSGITELVVNTVDRWVDYQLYDSYDGMKFRVDSREHGDDYPHKIKIYAIKFAKPANTIKLEQQDKYQIAFYFIPHELLDINVKNR